MHHLISEIRRGIELLSLPVNVTSAVKSLCSDSELESCENGSSSLFTSAEIDVLNRFRSEKRRKEWVTGRVAAKEAASEFLRRTPSEPIEILMGNNGEPLVQEPIFISITHSNGIALALVSEAPVGVDLEKVEERPDSFLDFYFSEKEKDFISEKDHLATDEQITALWTAKEAVSKVLGKGGQLNFKTIECNRKFAVVDKNISSIELFKCCSEHFCISAAILKKREK